MYNTAELDLPRQTQDKLALLGANTADLYLSLLCTHTADPALDLMIIRRALACVEQWRRLSLLSAGMLHKSTSPKGLEHTQALVKRRPSNQQCCLHAKS